MNNAHEVLCLCILDFQFFGLLVINHKRSEVSPYLWGVVDVLCVLKKTNFSYFYSKTGYFFCLCSFLNEFSISVFILGKSRYSGRVAFKGAHVSGWFIKKQRRKNKKWYLCVCIGGRIVFFIQKKEYLYLCWLRLMFKMLWLHKLFNIFAILVILGTLGFSLIVAFDLFWYKKNIFVRLLKFKEKDFLFMLSYYLCLLWFGEYFDIWKVWFVP